MKLVMRHLHERTVEAIRVTMAAELAAGKVKLSGARRVNVATFDMDHPARRVGELSIEHPEYSYVLNGLAKKLSAEKARVERLRRNKQLAG